MTQELTSIPKSKPEYVARNLLDQIIASNLEPGSNFGTEAELLEQYNVSRPTFRESLGILEAQGVLELRPGPRGGILVSKPGMDVLAHALSVYLRLHDVPFIEVLKAREAIEPALSASAAEFADAQDLLDMQASIDWMKKSKDSPEFIEEDRTFHFPGGKGQQEPGHFDFLLYDQHDGRERSAWREQYRQEPTVRHQRASGDPGRQRKQGCGPRLSPDGRSSG